MHIDFLFWPSGQKNRLGTDLAGLQIPAKRGMLTIGRSFEKGIQVQNNREIIEDLIGKHNVVSYIESEKKITFELPIFQIPETLLISILKVMNLRDIATSNNKITIYKRR